MKIFISWSGETSQKIASLIKDFIPKVIQSAKPYYTPDDIEKGMKWETEINQHLAKCTMGLICLTKDNTNKPWILFEAGALSNRLEKAKVCPILFGINKAEVTGPLSTFQLTEFTRDDFLKLIKSINNSLDESIDETNLIEIYNAFFSSLEKEIKNIISEGMSIKKDPKAKRPERDILEEILLLLRRQERRITLLEEEREKVIQRRKFKETEYTMDSSFKPGDKVYAPEYGMGTVKRVDDGFLMVIFSEKGKIARTAMLSESDCIKVID
ncbi:TIR domain-containing protein [Capnocytophaga canis]|uniref:TIR domain-containing protein n=1 Tax=Capnocytophaga canis TaxID=1848903 RepID=A0A0B7I216_9FLAO|nr:TIR domain-containing protein [Capnocytophaga canis]CEN45690.1 hypothetical protein CCAND38_270007 [Capnocytophaga canis]